MNRWFFPSSGYGEIEGFSNPGLEMFKGEPIRAMAREVCQNSLDAKKENSHPLRIEFERIFMLVSDFPGMNDMKKVLEKCNSFWKSQGDEKTMDFLENAQKEIEGNNFFVLRISDYNTQGLKGAFEGNRSITPWRSLVQGNAFSVKNNEIAAGSYGIGKAAPFVVSDLQTVFYRTYDEDGIRAAQGVTHLVSFEDDEVILGEDKIKRATGYFSNGIQNKPFEEIHELEMIHKRNEYGTDLFIPAFHYVTGKNLSWSDEVIIEILDNFLYSICSGKMEVTVDGKKITAKNVENYINMYLPKTKHASSFWNVIRDDNENVVEEIKSFHDLGFLRLRILYEANANKKVLVVRNSGMKIANIPSLPKGIAYTAFLELKGEKLNQFFRKMENPQHNKWEHKRHPDPKLAKKYKEEVEEWVRNFIGDKIKELGGDEMDIDVSTYFMSSEKQNDQYLDDKVENIVDTVKTIDVVQEEPKHKDFNVKDIGGNQGNYSKDNRKPGTIDDKGDGIGHRTRTGNNPGGSKTGRRGSSTKGGVDTLYEQMREISVRARIIKKTNGTNKLIFVAEHDIQQGELEIVTVGENGKPLQIKVKTVNGNDVLASVKDGHIVIKDVKENKKYTIEFNVSTQKTYAMGVKAYGN